MSNDNKIKVLVCGSRTWADENAIRSALQALNPVAVIIIDGAAKGADTLAHSIAKELGFETERYPADWKTYGKQAGYLRNLQMLAQDPDLVIAFWDGQSRGTKHTIDEAQKRGIETVIHKPATATILKLQAEEKTNET